MTSLLRLPGRIQSRYLSGIPFGELAAVSLIGTPIGEVVADFFLEDALSFPQGSRDFYRLDSVNPTTVTVDRRGFPWRRQAEAGITDEDGTIDRILWERIGFIDVGSSRRKIFTHADITRTAPNGDIISRIVLDVHPDTYDLGVLLNPDGRPPLHARFNFLGQRLEPPQQSP